MKLKIFFSLLGILSSVLLKAQELKYNFDETGETYVKTTFLMQGWSRWTSTNPGSQLNGNAQENIWDMGLRRVRTQIMIKPNKRTFIYAQLGNNNLSFNTTRKQGIFFHDVSGEINFIDQKLTMGMGLTGWGGYMRFSAPAAASILGFDTPLYQQATNDVTDQFLRKFSFFAKGKLGKLDYRLAVSKPMTANQASATNGPLSAISSFTPFYSNPQVHGYCYWSFKESETNTTAYLPGTYLGNKQILNIGLGFMHQKNALWSKEATQTDTSYHDLTLLSLDVFFEQPLNKEKKNALSIYSALSYQDFGPQYVRSIGIMNPMNGTKSSTSFGGYGNSFPVIGSGITQFFQMAYLFKSDLLKKWGTLQLFYNGQKNEFDGIKNTFTSHEGGINWLIDQNKTKITFGVQNRPIFETTSIGGKPVESCRRNGLILQFQFFI